MLGHPDDVDVTAFVRRAAAHPGRISVGWTVRVLLAAVPEERVAPLLSEVAAALRPDETAIALAAECAPGSPAGWRAAEGLGSAAAHHYLGAVRLDGFWLSEDERRHAVERLLRAGRPRWAFAIGRHEPGHLPATLWVRVMTDLANRDDDGPRPSGHDVEEVFEALDAAEELPITEVARLEIPLVRALDHGRSRTLALHRCMGMDHEDYVRFLAMTCPRSDGAGDPLGWQNEDPELARAWSTIAYRLLDT